LCCVWFGNVISGQSWSKQKWIVSIWRDAVRLWQKRIEGCRRSFKNSEPWKLLNHSTCSFRPQLSPCVPLVKGLPQIPQQRTKLLPPSTITLLNSLSSYLSASPEYCPSPMPRPKQPRHKPKLKPIRYPLHDLHSMNNFFFGWFLHIIYNIYIYIYIYIKIVRYYGIS